MDIPAELIDTLKLARRVMVVSGAGISAESGLATFRDPLSGLWARFDPQELATPGAFQRDPSLVWGWYEWRRMKALKAAPNLGHLALSGLASLVAELTLVTQNVDDLHERAGSTNVIHLHGTLSSPYCISCAEPFALPAGIPQEPEDGQRRNPPRCRRCGSLVRPGVVWFGEGLPQTPWRIAEHAAQNCDVFLCVGTSSVVYPAASLIEIAAARGATTVQINPGSTQWDSRVTYDFRGSAGVVLPAIVDLLRA